jgi:hypothetical protein
MALKTITAANALFTLSVPGAGLVEYTLEGYAADAAFATDSLTVAETVMGVDGKMSFGRLPTIKPQSIQLMPDSKSVEFFNAWYNAQEVLGDAIPALGRITIPGLGVSYVLTKGVLKQYSPISAAAKAMQAQTFAIDWENITATPWVQ